MILYNLNQHIPIWLHACNLNLLCLQDFRCAEHIVYFLCAFCCCCCCFNLIWPLYFVQLTFKTSDYPLIIHRTSYISTHFRDIACLCSSNKQHETMNNNKNENNFFFGCFLFLFNFIKCLLGISQLLNQSHIRNKSIQSVTFDRNENKTF